MEVVNLRLRSLGRVTPPELAPAEPGAEDPSSACIGRRGMRLEGGVEAEVPVYQRDRMAAGMAFPGPGLVVEYSSTVWVPEGARLEVDPWGALGLETGA